MILKLKILFSRYFLLVVVVGVFALNFSAEAQVYSWIDQLISPITDSSVAGRGTAMDDKGNVVAVGSFLKKFDLSSYSGSSLTSTGGADIFIVKFNTTGSVLWNRTMGGGCFTAHGWGNPWSYCDDRAKAVTIDKNNNIIITGGYVQTTTYGGVTLNSNGGIDVFIAKLDPNGNLIWLIGGGGAGNDDGADITTDSNGDIYLAGGFAEEAQFGGITISAPSQDIASERRTNFLAKLDTNGNVIYVKTTGNQGPIFPFPTYTTSAGDNTVVTTDGNNDVVVASACRGDVTFDSIALPDLHNPGGALTCLAKYSSSGSILWALREGGGGPFNITADKKNRIILVGKFNNPTLLSNGQNLVTPYPGQGLFFVAQYDPSGNMNWVKQPQNILTTTSGISPQVSTYGLSLYYPKRGVVQIAGTYRGQISLDSFTLPRTLGAKYNFFMAKIDEAGMTQSVATIKGGLLNDVYDMASHPKIDYSAITGYFQSTMDFGSLVLNAGGSPDGFLTVFH